MKCPHCNREIVEKDPETREQAKAILDYLNEMTGKNYRHVESNIKMVSSRIKEYSHEEVAKVVAHRCKKWKGTKMEEYLRPMTLFRASNFANYIGEV